jgi:hypothetical protein
MNNMNTTTFIRLKQFLLVGLVSMLFLGCERDISNLEPATYPTNPDIFINGFSSGLNYAAFGSSVPTAFDVDKNVTYNNSSASMKFEVPDYDDPRGAYAGGVFFTSVGRNLSEYNALTFWAKATQPCSINEIGFGNDMGESKYQSTIYGLGLNTNWKKYIIHIPDPSRLTMERGMLYYAEGPENGLGYTFWIDEVKFEKLGNIAHTKGAILNGENKTETSFTGISKNLTGLSSVCNLPNGVDQSVYISPSFFEFSSSNEAVATVDAFGKVTTGVAGTAVITAKLGGVDATGSLTINSLGVFQQDQTPIYDPSNVISVFSNAYTNVPVNYYNGYWAPYQTTLSADFAVNGDNILNYTNFNFVGIEFSSPTINASTMTHLCVSIYIPGNINLGAQFKIKLVDAGPNGTLGNSDDISSQFVSFSAYSNPALVAQNWVRFNIPLSSFTGLTSRTKLGQLIFEGTNISNFYADNIYFHK